MSGGYLRRGNCGKNELSLSTMLWRYAHLRKSANCLLSTALTICPPPQICQLPFVHCADDMPTSTKLPIAFCWQTCYGCPVILCVGKHAMVAQWYYMLPVSSYCCYLVTAMSAKSTICQALYLPSVIFCQNPLPTAMSAKGSTRVYNLHYISFSHWFICQGLYLPSLTAIALFLKIKKGYFYLTMNDW